jgi:hypothetical protein
MAQDRDSGMSSAQNQNTKEVKKIRRSLHHISAQNSILRAENRGLREALFIKKKREKKSYTLQLNNSNEYHGGAVFYSPKKIRQAHLDEIEKRRQKDEIKLQKAERKQLQQQARLYKLQQVKDRRDLRRCGRRRKPPRQLKRKPRKLPATLKKPYNCPKRVSARPHKALLKSRSVRNVLLLIHLMYKPMWLHHLSQLKPPALAAPPRYQVNTSSTS